MKKNKKRIEMLNREYDREQIALKLNRLEAIMNDPELSDSEKMRQANELDDIYDCGNNSRAIQDERIVDDIFGCHNSSVNDDSEYNGDLQFYNEPAPQVPQNNAPKNTTSNIAADTTLSNTDVLNNFKRTCIIDKTFCNVDEFISSVREATTNDMVAFHKLFDDLKKVDRNAKYTFSIQNLDFGIDDTSDSFIIQHRNIKARPAYVSRFNSPVKKINSISSQDMYAIIMLVERIVYNTLIMTDDAIPNQPVQRNIIIPGVNNLYNFRLSNTLYDMLVANIVCALILDKHSSEVLNMILFDEIYPNKYEGELLALSGFRTMIHGHITDNCAEDCDEEDTAETIYEDVDDATLDSEELDEEDFEESVEVDIDEITEEAWEESEELSEEEFSEEEMEFESDEEYISEEDAFSSDDEDDHIIMKPRY